MTNGRSCGRGMLRFTSLKPCRRPGQVVNENSASVKHEAVSSSVLQNTQSDNSSHVSVGQNNTSQKLPDGVPTPPVQKGEKPIILLAKYNYQANLERPGGFDEVSLIQGEKLEFCRGHPSNPYWWEVKNNKGDTGFAPANYVMVLEEKITVLPWLEQEAASAAGSYEEDENIDPTNSSCEPVFKPYVSAYADNSNKTSTSQQYYCEICDKKLNGPIPYQVHMNSKGHKEEAALRKEYDS